MVSNDILQYIWFQVTGATRVCSQHFKKEDYRWNPVKKFNLVKGAIPSVFPWTNMAQKRKPPAPRFRWDKITISHRVNCSCLKWHSFRFLNSICITPFHMVLWVYCWIIVQFFINFFIILVLQFSFLLWNFTQHQDIYAYHGRTALDGKSIR